MYAKLRGSRIQLYRSSYVPVGRDGNTQGYFRQDFVGSLPADSQSIPPELASKLTPAELRYVEGMLLRAKEKKTVKELQG